MGSRFVLCLRVVMFISAGGGFCFGADGVASDVSPPGEYIGLGSADHAGGKLSLAVSEIRIGKTAKD